MTQEQFMNAVLEQLFVRGFNCWNMPLLSMYADVERERLGAWPDPSSFAEQCDRVTAVTHQPELMGKVPSSTSGAGERWLGVHEAGHAIVGIKAGFILRGVRFYGDDGFPGETGFEDSEWRTSDDEDLLRRLIRVDVAGNIAEMLRPACRTPEGRLSGHYNDSTPGERPTDFISADARALQLANVQFERVGREQVVAELSEARREIVRQADVEAEQVLRENLEMLGRLAGQLQRGPMTGTAVRLLLASDAV